MSIAAWISSAVAAVAAIAYAVVRFIRGRRRASLVQDGRAAALGAERTAAGVEARNAAQRDEDRRRAARTAEDAERIVKATQAAPPVPPVEGGVRVGRRPRSDYADELGLD